MDFEITEEEAISLIKDGYEEQIFSATKQIIEFCRNKEREYKEGLGEISGVEFLTTLHTQRNMDINLYLKLREAVANYNEPYEITLIVK